jgi:hypothetical protein
MNAKTLAKHYASLTAEERFRLIGAAGARGEKAEQDRLAAAAGRRIMEADRWRWGPFFTQNFSHGQLVRCYHQASESQQCGDRLPMPRLTQQQLEAHLWGAANILRGRTAGAGLQDVHPVADVL